MFPAFRDINSEQRRRNLEHQPGEEESETNKKGTRVLVPRSFFEEYNKVCVQAAEWLQLCDILAEALELAGQHEGPCDPDSEWEGCELHWKTAERRRQVALDAWRKVRGIQNHGLQEPDP